MDTQGIIDKAKDLKIAVIGDFMLDRYIMSDVDRISPEAPVLVALMKDTHAKPGGAGNVYMNLCNLGVQTYLFCDAKDPYSVSKFMDRPNGHLYIQQGTNAVKTRIMSRGHHILRIDDEQPYDQIVWKGYEQMDWQKSFEELLPTFDVVVISDYNKGVISDSVAKSVIALCINAGKPVVVDAKKDFYRFKGATILKCNDKEAGDVDRYTMNDKHGIEYFIVTCGEAGISLYNNGYGEGFNGHRVDIVDICGAGDTVTAILAIGIKLDIKDCIRLANIAASEVCTHPGVHPIVMDDLVNRINKLNV